MGTQNGWGELPRVPVTLLLVLGQKWRHSDMRSRGTGEEAFESQCWVRGELYGGPNLCQAVVGGQSGVWGADVHMNAVMFAVNSP